MSYRKGLKGTLIQELQQDEMSGVSYKNTLLKKQVLEILSSQGNATLADLGRQLNVSTPKINELITELIAEGLVRDFGKSNAGVGRKPNIYGLEASSAHFIGVEVKRESINIGLMDFSEKFLKIELDIPFHLENSNESLDQLCSKIEEFIDSTTVPKDKILAACVNISGRVNHKTGYSYSFFHLHQEPLSQIIRDRIGIHTYLENDTRGMAFGEFYSGVVTSEKSVLFVNIDEGIGMGIMIDGKLYYGKSGFAGEFGHIPLLANDIICHCGKKGCLETEASGLAITQQFKARLKQGATSIVTNTVSDIAKINLQHIIHAALNDDMLAIEIISEAGEKIGRGIAAIMNLFNPELIILGGSLAETDAYIRLPIKAAINKYSLSLVSTDTELRMSSLGRKAGVMGACLLARDKILSIQ
ncbi:ROK family transcriptional regulator [Pontibacter sp. BT731]|uniref:ROK family transcriptional regulator n=1 Tax=Pontibacter coccineus TaxID=3063328 RepID=UPI0026E38332|nr:ROK family transcriptional regulator [Pontibacter sp. BT731]MDO6390080.1 ROK family transcriptional regulator [Pontibacter sp. BT731]